MNMIVEFYDSTNKGVLFQKKIECDKIPSNNAVAQDEMIRLFFEKVKVTYFEFVTLLNSLIASSISKPATVYAFVVEILFTPSKIIERKNIEMTLPLSEEVLISYIHQRIANYCFWFMADRGNLLVENMINEYQKNKMCSDILSIKKDMKCDVAAAIEIKKLMIKEKMVKVKINALELKTKIQK